MNIPSELLNKDLIFHFTKARIAMENILPEGKLRFSPMCEMNDPYEYKLPSRGVASIGGLDDGLAKQATALLGSTILKNSKVACFVEASNKDCDPFNLPFIKPRCWAQFGEQQFGVCLVFDKTVLLKTVHDKISDITVFNDSVVYDLDTNNSSKKARLKYNQGQSAELNIREHLARHCKDIFFRKYSDFSGENEYRIVLVDESKHRQYLFCPLKQSLRAVILGDRFCKVYRRLIKELCESHSAKTYTLRYLSAPYIDELKIT